MENGPCLAAEEASEGERGELAVVVASSVDVGDVDLDGSVVSRGDETVSGGAGRG